MTLCEGNILLAKEYLPIIFNSLNLSRAGWFSKLFPIKSFPYCFDLFDISFVVANSKGARTSKEGL